MKCYIFCRGAGGKKTFRQDLLLVAGLPDGFFSDQKDPIWVYFGGPWNGKYYTYILVFSNILLPLGIFNGNLAILK
jgi:hypothetical protein